MNRIEEKFKELSKNNQKAFIVFLTCGYPDLDTTLRLVLEFSRIGVDIVELGIPFSDPLADGVVIQEASQVALNNKVDILKVFRLVKKIRKYSSIPICLMSYYNPVFCMGLERFILMCKRSEVDGLIIPDLPAEESQDLLKIAKSYSIDVIFFIAPTTTIERIKTISKLSRGFIYYVSLTGVTGPRDRLAEDLIENLKEIKKITSKPICVGFGISDPKQIKTIYKVADGVIVGSAVIKKIQENLKSKNLIKKVVDFVTWLKS